MRKYVSKTFLLILFTAALTPEAISGLDTSRDRLYADFWYEIEPMQLEDFSRGIKEQDKNRGIQEMLREAQFVFSGMIFGYSVLYTPSDKTRKVEEILEITPAAQIPWGDPNFRVESTRIDGDRLHALVSYTLRDYQKYRLKSWDANTFPSATGTGKGDYFKGTDEKITSYKNGVKEAIRGYLRKRIYNKPKEIKALVILSDPPRCIVDEGSYISTVKIKLQITELLPYSIQ